MTDLPPPSAGGTPPPPPSMIPPAPPVSSAARVVPGGARYRVLPFVIPLSAAMAATLVTRLIVIFRSGTRTEAARQFLADEITEAVYDDRVGAIAGIETVSGLAQNVVAVLSIILLYRMLANLRAKQRNTAWAPPWAIFGWILPPGLIVIPTLFVSEAWKASSTRGDWRRERTNPLIWAWAAAYAGASIISTIAGFRLVTTLFNLGDLATESNTRDAAQAIVDNTAMLNVGEAVMIVAGVLWVLVVRQLSTLHARNITGEID